jgi:hypothetical protein
LGEYELPDPEKVMEIVFSKKADTSYKEASQAHCPAFSTEKTAKTVASPITFDLRNLSKDLSTMSAGAIQEMFYPGTKVAESEKESVFEKLKKPGSGVSITQITASASVPTKEGSSDRDSIDALPATREEILEAWLKKMSTALSDRIDSTLRDLIKKSASAKTEAYADASDAYARLGGMVTSFGHRLRRPFEDISYKAAGLASVNVYYPDVSELIRPFISEVQASKLKTAEYNALDLSSCHEFVATAKEIHAQVEKTAELTLNANQAKEYHDGLTDFYDNRPRGTQADWMPFVSAEVLEPKQAGVGLGVTATLGYLVGSRQKNNLNSWADAGRQKATLGYDSTPSVPDSVKTRAAEEAAETADQYGGLSSRSALLNSKNIETLSMLNDFSVNDEILGVYPIHELVGAYGDLAKTAPHVMRDKILARAFLQQYMSQGRFAPSELDPALKFDDSLAKRFNLLLGEGQQR